MILTVRGQSAELSAYLSLAPGFCALTTVDGRPVHGLGLELVGGTAMETTERSVVRQ